MKTSSDVFPIMADVIAPTEVGEACIDHFQVGKTAGQFAMMRAAMDGDKHAFTQPGTYARLRVNGELMMTDTDMERQTNFRFVIEASGRVLVAGLGLGMILHAIADKADVTEIVVIEKSQDVIDAVIGSLPKQKPLTVICADIDTWDPAKDERFDTIYFDIWPERSVENLPQINALHRRFRKYLRDPVASWMGSWYHQELKHERDRDRRNERRFGGF